MKTPALPLPAALSSGRLAGLVDAEKAALLCAKFMAWWDGKDFDAEAFAAARAERAAAKANAAANVAGPAPPSKPPRVAEGRDLFEGTLPLAPARLEALSAIWGPGRVMPSVEDEERAHLVRLAPTVDAPLALIGPGGIGPVRVVGRYHAGPMSVFEWREEAQGHLKASLAQLECAGRTSLIAHDLELFAPQEGAFAAVICLDELTYCATPKRFCRQIAKMLAPSGVALIEAYGLRGAPCLREAFASAFAEPQVLAVEAMVEVLAEAGLRIDAQDDVTTEHLRHARAGFKRLNAFLEAGPELTPAVAREIGWEAEAWRARVSLLRSGQLVRRQFIVSRMGEA
jgi:SAM-dependent methyltransferase